MKVKINTQELEEVLLLTPETQNIMLVGKHGIGKSEILSNFFKKQGIQVITLFLGQMSDPGDLIGLPTKNEKTGKTDFMPPYWFPTDNTPIVLFLDELNRARPEVLQTIMDLTLNRTLAGRKLPENSRVISAVNDGDEYQLTELDPALVSRFNIYTFQPSAQEWLLWAVKNNIDERIVSFIEENPIFLDTNNTEELNEGLVKTPDRRAWARVSAILKEVENPTPIHKKMVAGIIGLKATASFFNSFANNKIISAKTLLSGFKKNKTKVEKYQLHEISVLNESIFRYLETTQWTNEQKQKIAENLQLYTDFLLESEKNEAFAHFISVYEKNSYPQAVVFLAQQTPVLFQKITDFILSM